MDAFLCVIRGCFNIMFLKAKKKGKKYKQTPDIKLKNIAS